MSDQRHWGKRKHESNDSYGEKRRFVEGEGTGRIIARHYNELEEKGVSARQQSRILRLRNCNNWIKSTLLSDVMQQIWDRSKQNLTILDMCCGKGGDIQKYVKNYHVGHVVFADIAQTSVEQCEGRYRDAARRQNRMFSAEFIAADCTKERLKEKYKNPGLPIDLVSVQFGFHYSFESLSQVEKMLQNVSENLKYGGYFVGTIPNADRIVQKYREAGKKEFGNTVYTIKFETEEPLPLFGAKYYFQLDEVVNCPEFLVYFPCFEALAEQYNLKLDYKCNFDEYFYKKHKEGEFLLNKMEALETYPSPRGQNFDDPEEFSHARSFLENKSGHPPVGTISKSEWDAISLYTVFCFQKVAPRK